ncbi:MAG: hypothetical protein ACERKN_16930 [Velocimicrobium sp.]
MKYVVKKYGILLSLLLVVLLTKTIKVMASEQRVFSVFGMGEMEDKGQRKKVTREEFAKMITYLSGEDNGKQNYFRMAYPDMIKNTSYSFYVNVVTLKGWMSGNIFGNFKPKKAITLNDAARAVIAMLGYKAKDDGSNYSQKEIMNLYYEIGLDKNIKARKNEGLTYREVEELFSNLTRAKNKAGVYYFESLGGKMREDGSLNIGSILKAKLKGPLVGVLGWKQLLPFSLKHKKIYVNECEVENYRESKNDVVYYDPRNKSIWIYNNLVEGILQSVSPNQRKPEELSVDGENFAIATSQVKQLIMEKGDDLINTKVTLLLGVNDEVTNIQSDILLDESFTGVIIKLGSKTNESKQSKEVLSKYMIVVDWEGKKHTIFYPYKNTIYKTNDVVNVIGTGGTIDIQEKIVSNGQLSGKYVDAENYKIGDKKISAQVSVIDVRKESAKRISFQKIAGMKLKLNQILYYETNEIGEVSSIFLKNIVGSDNNYVLITKLKPNFDGNGQVMEYEVNYLYNGEEKEKNMLPQKVDNLVISGRAYRLEEYDDKSFQFYPEDSYEVKTINGTHMIGNEVDYVVPDDIQVYYRASDGSYHKTTLERVRDLNTYRLQAFYEKNSNQIKTISVLLASDR